MKAIHIGRIRKTARGDEAIKRDFEQLRQTAKNMVSSLLCENGFVSTCTNTCNNSKELYKVEKLTDKTHTRECCAPLSTNFQTKSQGIVQLIVKVYSHWAFVTFSVNGNANARMGAVPIDYTVLSFAADAKVSNNGSNIRHSRIYLKDATKVLCSINALIGFDSEIPYLQKKKLWGRWCLYFGLIAAMHLVLFRSLWASDVAVYSKTCRLWPLKM